MARRVVDRAIPCPFCGCTKMYQKTWSAGHRLGASVQCSKCHVDGPKVYTEEFELLPVLGSPSQVVIYDLWARSLEKWNERH